VGSGLAGVIYSTSDAGEHWQMVAHEGAAHSFNDVHFWTDQKGCAVGGSVLLYCTADGGASWASRKVLPGEDSTSHVSQNAFKNVVFVNDKRGWIVSNGGFLFETTDGGNTWQRVDPTKLGR